MMLPLIQLFYKEDTPIPGCRWVVREVDGGTESEMHTEQVYIEGPTAWTRTLRSGLPVIECVGHIKRYTPEEVYIA